MKISQTIFQIFSTYPFWKSIQEIFLFSYDCLIWEERNYIEICKIQNFATIFQIFSSYPFWKSIQEIFLFSYDRLTWEERNYIEICKIEKLFFKFSRLIHFELSFHGEYFFWKGLIPLLRSILSAFKTARNAFIRVTRGLDSKEPHPRQRERNQACPRILHRRLPSPPFSRLNQPV